MDSWQYESIPFGKHEGQSIGDIPTQYLSWLIKQGWFDESFPELAEAVRACLKARSERKRATKPPTGLTTDIVKRWHRTLVLKFHPDREGGSHQAMTAINDARDLLLSMIGGGA